jgi:hypothetical protein
MKYKVPRPIIGQELLHIVHREIKKQEIPIARISKRNLKELADVSQAIEKHGIPKYLVCKKLGHGLGRGIFLHPKARPILRGQIIASYAGEISITPQHEPDDGSYAFAPLERFYLNKKEQALFDKKKAYHPRRLYSLKLDAFKRGNFTRFINHSERPNIFADTLKIPTNSFGLVPTPIEIIYVAKKTIHPGEQLLISYEDGEKSYWHASKIKPFPMTPKTFSLSSSLQLKTIKTIAKVFASKISF